MALAGLIAAIGTDIDAWVKAREKDKTARFDWALAFGRAVKGAIYGALPGMGIGATVTAPA